MYSTTLRVSAARFTPDEFRRGLNDLYELVKDQEHATQCDFHFALRGGEEQDIKGLPDDLDVPWERIRSFRAAIPDRFGRRFSFRYGDIWTSLEIYSDSKEWMDKARRTATQLLREARPWWWWFRTTPVQFVSYGLLCLAAAIAAGSTLNAVAYPRDFANALLVAAVMLVLYLPGGIAGFQRRFRIISGRDARGKWIGLGKWLGALVAGAALSWVLGQLFTLR